MGTLRGAVGGTSRTGIAGSVQAVPRLNNAQDQPSVAAQELWRNTQYPNPFNGTTADLFANGEQGVWYDPSDFSTMYQNSTGTTPVTALGQPVGLILDKSRWDGRGVVNLLTRTEEFNVGWSLGSTTVAINALEAPDGTLTADEITITNANGHWVYQSVGVIPNTQYIFSFYVRRGTATALRYSVFNDNAASNIVAPTSYYFQTSSFGWARISVPFTTPSGCTSVRVYPVRDSGSLGTVYLWGAQLELGSTATTYQANGVSVGGPGNHARQTGDAARPTVQARSNMLIRTEEFNDATWTKNGTTVSQDATNAPNGTLTADKLVETATNSSHVVFPAAGFTPIIGATYTWSVYAKASERSFLVIDAFLGGSSNFTYFNLTNGTVGQNASGSTATIADIGDGWYRCSVTRTSAFSSGGSYGVAVASANGTNVYLGTGVSGLFIWGAQLELASAAGPYQRVTTATDYADIGLPRYLQFDGTDDSLVTAATVDFSGTNQMTVCGGVFKQSDTAYGAILDLTADPDNTNGGFAYGVSTLTGDASRRTYSLVFRRTVASLNSAYIYAAPDLKVFTGQWDGAQLTANAQLTIRLNGATPTTAVNAPNATSGVFANAQMFVGRRNQASSPFNGRIYQLIVRGAITGGKLLAQTERYVAEKTGITGL